MSNEQPVAKTLKTRVRNLENKLAESVPKTELELLRASVEANFGDLEAKLRQSAPKEEADSLRVRLEELESRLAESIPKRDAQAELESVKSALRGEVEGLESKLAGSNSGVDSIRADLAQLRAGLAEFASKAEWEAKGKELETKLSDATRDLEVARATMADLEKKFSQSSAKIDELQVQVSSSAPRMQFETTRNEFRSKITDLEEKLVSFVPRNEADELRARVAQVEEELSRSASKADADALKEKANRLENALTEASERLSSAETRSRELEYRLAESKSETAVLKEKLAGTFRSLTHYIKAWLSLYTFYYDLMRRHQTEVNLQPTRLDPLNTQT